MNDKLSEKQLEDAWKAFVHLPWESTYSSRQNSFELFSLQQRAAIKSELGETIPEFNKLTFEEANTILIVTGFGTTREGAKALASLSYSQGAPLIAFQVGFETLVEAADQTARPDSKEHGLLRETMAALPLLDALVSASAQGIINKLIERFAMLKDHEERLNRIVITNLIHGIRLEFLFGHLSEKESADRLLMSKILARVASNPGTIDPKDIERMKAKFTSSQSGASWPRDLICPCGASLEESISCCDKTIDTKELLDAISADYILKTDCCGAGLTGFRCTVCGMYNSWAKGIVDSHS
jgi:hypothetical protein